MEREISGPADSRYQIFWNRKVIHVDTASGQAVAIPALGIC